MMGEIIELPAAFKVHDQQKMADSEICIKISGKINALYRGAAYVFVKYINNIRCIDVNYGMCCDLKDYSAIETNYIYEAREKEDEENDQGAYAWCLRYDTENMRVVENKTELMSDNIGGYTKRVVKKIIEETLNDMG